MNKKIFIVPTISCNHCTAAIIEEVQEIKGVLTVSAEVDTRQVTVEWEAPATWDVIQAILHEINYPPQQLIQL